MTQGAIEVWASLPDEIRRDQSFIPFHEENERMTSKQIFKPQFEIKKMYYAISNLKISIGRPDAVAKNQLHNENLLQTENVLNGSYLANNEFITISLEEREENNKNQLENG